MADVDFWQTNLLLEVLTGSRAQGLAGPESDTDSRGVCIPPREVLLGLEDFEQYEERGGDRVVYALSKLVRLALDGNPNIIEVLYAEPEDVLFLRRFGERLLAERDAFLTRRVGERFLGYAGHQLRRMERHHRWLVSPPGSEPEPADHGARRADGRWRFPDTDSEKAYRAAHRHWEHFRTWRRNRNAARAELEAGAKNRALAAEYRDPLRIGRRGREGLMQGRYHLLVYRVPFLRSRQSNSAHGPIGLDANFAHRLASNPTP